MSDFELEPLVAKPEAPKPVESKALKRMIRSASLTVLQDPRTEDVPYIPDDEEPDRVVRSKELKVEDVPGYGRVGMYIPDVCDADRFGRAQCDIGVQRATEPHLEERERFLFTGDYAFYESGTYDAEQNTYTEGVVLHGKTPEELTQIEGKLEHLLQAVELTR